MADANVITDDTSASSIETDNMNQAENYTDDTTAKGEKMIPKSRFDQVLEQKKRASDALRTVADEMVEAAGIEEGMSVLEPSAGMGHIAERIRAAEDEVVLCPQRVPGRRKTE